MMPGKRQVEGPSRLSRSGCAVRDMGRALRHELCLKRLSKVYPQESCVRRVGSGRRTEEIAVVKDRNKVATVSYPKWGEQMGLTLER